jgi:hypothetical protein
VIFFYLFITLWDMKIINFQRQDHADQSTTSKTRVGRELSINKPMNNRG